MGGAIEVTMPMPKRCETRIERATTVKEIATLENIDCRIKRRDVHADIIIIRDLLSDYIAQLILWNNAM